MQKSGAADVLRSIAASADNYAVQPLPKMLFPGENSIS